MCIMILNLGFLSTPAAFPILSEGYSISHHQSAHLDFYSDGWMASAEAAVFSSLCAILDVY